MKDFKVVVTTGEDDAEKLLTLLTLFDLVEIRLDLFSADYLENRLVGFIQNLKKPVIFTYRLPEDSNQKSVSILSPENIDKILLQFASPENYLDIELNRKNEIFANFINSEYSRIYSYHNFTETLSLQDMQKEMQKIQNPAAKDIFKFAVMTKSLEKTAEFLSDIRQLSVSNRVTGICMGEHGVISRIFGDFYGSLLTYCSAGEERAPGQISVQTFHSFRSSVA